MYFEQKELLVLKKVLEGRLVCNIAHANSKYYLVSLSFLNTYNKYLDIAFFAFLKHLQQISWTLISFILFNINKKPRNP